METSFDGSYRLSDYLVYGETLSLYKNEYGTKKMDKMQGNNIVLRNVMNDAITSFTFNGKVDSGIDLGSLKEGIMNYIHIIIMKRSVFILTMHLRRRQSQQCVAIKGERYYVCGR